MSGIGRAIGFVIGRACRGRHEGRQGAHGAGLRWQGNPVEDDRGVLGIGLVDGRREHAVGDDAPERGVAIDGAAEDIGEDLGTIDEVLQDRGGEDRIALGDVQGHGGGGGGHAVGEPSEGDGGAWSTRPVPPAAHVLDREPVDHGAGEVLAHGEGEKPQGLGQLPGGDVLTQHRAYPAGGREGGLGAVGAAAGAMPAAVARHVPEVDDGEGGLREGAVRDAEILPVRVLQRRLFPGRAAEQPLDVRVLAFDQGERRGAAPGGLDGNMAWGVAGGDGQAPRAPRDRRPAGPRGNAHPAQVGGGNRVVIVSVHGPRPTSVTSRYAHLWRGTSPGG